jgi:hypothetical protein
MAISEPQIWLTPVQVFMKRSDREQSYRRGQNTLFSCREEESWELSNVRDSRTYITLETCVDRTGNPEKARPKGLQIIQQDVAESFVANPVAV